MGKANSYPEYIYDLIVVGSGTSAATYLSTVHQNHDNELPPIIILIIGKEDPWADARGYTPGQYTQYLNQASQLLDRGAGSIAPTSQHPTDRKEWAESNAEIINSNNSDHLDAEVKMIEKLVLPSGKQAFKITVVGANEYYVCTQVVLATGAGIEPRTQAVASYSNSTYHEVPQFAAALRDGVSVMNLDEFQNGNGNSAHGGGKKLAVFGPNAGTDAIMEASLRKYSMQNTYWFIKYGSVPGTDLTFDISDKSPSWNVQQAAADKQENGLVQRYDNDKQISLSKRAGKILIEYVSENTKKKIEVDFVVYAVGQRGGGINHRAADTGALASIVSDTIKGELEPIYDVNRRFASGPAQHVLGLQLKGTKKDYGLKVVGAGANQAARALGSHNFLDSYIEELLLNIRNISSLFQIILSRDTDFSWLHISKFKDIQDPLNQETLNAKGNAFILSLSQELNKKVPGVSEIAVNTRNVCVSVAKDLVYHQKLRQEARRQHLAQQTLGNRTRVTELLSAGFENTKPATTADNRLVGGLIANINAAQETLPTARIKNKHGGVNFSEDRQVIALYIAQNYPNIDASTANRIVDEIVSERVSKLRGFSESEIQSKLTQLKYDEDFPPAPKKKIIRRYVVCQ